VTENYPYDTVQAETSAAESPDVLHLQHFVEICAASSSAGHSTMNLLSSLKPTDEIDSIDGHAVYIARLVNFDDKVDKDPVLAHNGRIKSDTKRLQQQLPTLALT
jgi:hypothetical protein